LLSQTRTLNCNAEQDCATVQTNSFLSPKSRWFDKKSGVTSSIFNCRYSVFFWHLLLLEQMTKEVPGIRPAVISTETGTRLDEYRRFRHVVRNVYTHRFDPAKLGKLVNSAPELFARTKAELLAFAAFLEH
jgi:hypothetical protein